MRIASSYKWEISEITALMADLWLFLSEDERQSFAESMQVVTYRKHEPIYEVGNRPEYLMCLISGKVKIYRVFWLSCFDGRRMLSDFSCSV